MSAATLIIMSAVSISIIFFAARSMARTARERWWYCDTCGCYHNEDSERSEIEPIELRGTMMCEHCRQGKVNHLTK